MEIVHSDEVTKEVAATVEPLASKNANQLEVNMKGGGSIRVDAIKFRQSLLNLLSNACKFTSNGIVSLIVERVAHGEQDFVCWHVRDTGIGIAEGDIKRLFQPFVQVDSSATRRHGGTGLGLAISQRLCRVMGGNITLQSKVGAGSTFTVKMPVAEN